MLFQKVLIEGSHTYVNTRLTYKAERLRSVLYDLKKPTITGFHLSKQKYILLLNHVLSQSSTNHMRRARILKKMKFKLTRRL